MLMLYMGTSCPEYHRLTTLYLPVLLSKATINARDSLEVTYHPL